MFGVNYNPFTETTIKGSVSKGFRSPTVMEMYLFAPNPDLQPEEMINYELGWLQSFYNGKIRTELTVFTADGDNMIQTVGQYPNMRRENVGTFSNKGIELALQLRPITKLYVNANYSYLDLNKVVLAAPKHQINLSANYTVNLFNFNIAMQHVDRLYTSTTPEITESYTLLNVRVEAKVYKNIKVFAMANNLLSEEYEINYGYPMPEINFNGGVKLNF
jgi:iron complex outermembrane receptor protein